MNKAHKTLILIVAAASVMWTACGKDARKGRPPGKADPTKIPDTLKPDTSEGSPNEALQGYWLRQAPKVENGVEKMVIWDIKVTGDKLSMRVILNCKKTEAGKVEKDGKMEDVSASIAATRLSFIVQKPLNVQATTNKIFKTSCSTTEGADKYTIDANDKLLGLKKGGTTKLDLCRLEKRSDGALETANSCKEKTVIDDASIVASVVGGNRTSPPPAQERILTESQIDTQLLGTWASAPAESEKSGTEANGKVSVSYTLVITRDSITKTKSCYDGVNARKEVSVTAKAKVTATDITILESQEKSEKFGEHDCKVSLVEKENLSLKVDSQNRLKVIRNVVGQAVTKETYAREIDTP